MALAAGQDYPGSYAELRAWFDEDWKCLDYLDWLRWPQGFVCPRCAHAGGWRGSDRRWRCAGCDRRVSATAGTIFDNTRTPLTIWFSVAWQMTSSKIGVSAIHVQREMGLGSYQTAWAMLHRYRSVMVRPGRDRPTGTSRSMSPTSAARRPAWPAVARWARCCSPVPSNAAPGAASVALDWPSSPTPAPPACARS